MIVLHRIFEMTEQRTSSQYKYINDHTQFYFYVGVPDVIDVFQDSNGAKMFSLILWFQNSDLF